MYNQKYNNLTTLTINQLFKVRLHLGHKNNKLNLTMLSVLDGKRHNINIFNLEKILISLRLIFKALSEIIKQRGYFFLLGTNKNLPMNNLFHYYFNKYSQTMQIEKHFFITGFMGLKWINGIFSNWQGMFKFIRYMQKSPKKDTTRYTNYLTALQGIDIASKKFLPDFVFAFNNDEIALTEIQKLNIPIIGITDSNSNSKYFLYNLIGNDDSIEAIQFFCNILEKSIYQGKILDQERFFIFCLNSFKNKFNIKYEKLFKT